MFTNGLPVQTQDFTDSDTCAQIVPALSIWSKNGAKNGGGNKSVKTYMCQYRQHYR